MILSWLFRKVIALISESPSSLTHTSPHTLSFQRAKSTHSETDTTPSPISPNALASFPWYLLLVGAMPLQSPAWACLCWVSFLLLSLSLKFMATLLARISSLPTCPFLPFSGVDDRYTRVPATRNRSHNQSGPAKSMQQTVIYVFNNIHRRPSAGLLVSSYLTDYRNRSFVSCYCSPRGVGEMLLISFHNVFFLEQSRL